MITPPGANLLSAVSSAASGDTIIAAPGSYGVGAGLVIDGKAITILGQPGANIYGTGGGPALMVRNVPAGRHFVLRGFDVVLGGNYLHRAFAVLGSAGGVHFSACRFIHYCTALSCAKAFEIRSSTLVTFNECRFQDVEVEVLSSSVHLARCTLQGHEARDLSISGARAATPGLWVQGDVTVAQCSIEGGAGDGRYAGAEAIAVLPGGRLTIAGDGSDAYAAGAPGATSQRLVPAITNYGQTVSIDGAIKLLPNQGAPAIFGPFSTSPRPISVGVVSAKPGGVARITVISDPGEPTVLFAGLPVPSRDVPPFGSLALDLQGAVVLGMITMGPTGHWTLPVPVPAIPSLSGIPFIAHAAAGGRQMAVRFSVPGPFVID